MRVGFGCLTGEVLEVHLLLLLDLEQGHLDSVVTAATRIEKLNIVSEVIVEESFRYCMITNYLLVDKEPAASVHEETAVGRGHVAFNASCHTLNLHLTRGQEVHAGD